VAVQSFFAQALWDMGSHCSVCIGLVRSRGG